MKKRSTMKWVGMALAGLGVASAGSAFATMQVDSKGGIKVSDPNETAYWFKLGGRTFLDGVVYSGSNKNTQNQFPSGANLRDLRVQLEGGIGEHLSFLTQIDYHPESASVKIGNAYVNYTGLAENTDLSFGKVSPPFGLDNWSNWGDLVFMEQALDGAFDPSDGLGVYADAALGDMVTIAAAVVAPQPSNSTNFGTDNGTTGRSDLLAEAARITFSPVHTEDAVYHLGASVWNQSLKPTDQTGAAITDWVGFSTQTELVARQTPYLFSTPWIQGRGETVWGLEAAGLWGPLHMTAEYQQATMRMNGFTPVGGTAAIKGNPVVSAWHVQAAYMLTGESRGYDFPSGTFSNPKPTAECGAWEVAARYSVINLNDKGIFGGSGHDVTLGVNWFVNDIVRVAVNYLNVRLHEYSLVGVPAVRKLSGLGARLQVKF